MTVTKWTPRGKLDASVKMESTDLLWYIPVTKYTRSIAETNVMKKLTQKIHRYECGQSANVRHLLVYIHIFQC